MTISLLISGLVLSILIGVLMGLIGGGGGAIFVILLTFTFGSPVHEAVGTALALSFFTTLSATYSHFKEKNIVPHLVMVLAGTGVCGAIIGAIVCVHMHEIVLKGMVIVAFIVIGGLSLYKTAAQKEHREKKSTSRRTLTGFLGMGTGLVSGALGISGTVPLATSLLVLTDISPIQAIGSSVATVTFVSLIGALVHSSQGAINVMFLALIGFGTSIGAFLGVRLLTKINRRILAIAVGIGTIGLAISMALEQLGVI